MPDQKCSVPAHVLATLTALFPAPLSWKGLLRMGVSAVKTEVLSSWNATRNIFLYLLHLHFLSRGHAPASRQQGSPWQWDKVQAGPGSAAFSWPLWLSGHEAAGRQLSSKELCVVIPLTFPSAYLTFCISRLPMSIAETQSRARVLV